MLPPKNVRCAMRLTPTIIDESTSETKLKIVEALPVIMVETGGTSWHQSNRGVSIYFAIYLMLFAFVIYLSKVLHDRPKIGSYLPEATMIILVGIVVGGVINLVAGATDNDEVVTDDDGDSDNGEGMADQLVQSMLGFSPTVFFVILLPPIIFNSGYQMNKELFFRHIIPISLYACLGTIICTLVIASCLHIAMPLFTFDAGFMELAAFGALISATDPVSTLAIFQAKKVDPHLFYLVFGESVINDAVSLVLFESLAHLVENQAELDVGQEVGQFLFDFITGIAGSLFLGTIFAVAYALLFKNVDLRHTPFLELCIYVTIMYSPFVLAEIFRLSGVVTVLFTGIAAKRYAEPNLSKSTATNSDTIFRLVAHVTETIIFLELGLSVFDLAGTGAFHVGFMIVSLILCLVGRAVDIYPITFLYNYIAVGTKPNDNDDRVRSLTLDENDGINAKINDTRIPLETAHMLWFSGLRGAVSYGLARMFPQTENQAIFVGVTMFIVLATTFFLGGSTEMALNHLKIETNVDEERYLRMLDKKPLLSQHLHRFEEVIIRQWVVRDYKAKNVDGDSTRNSSSDQSSTDDNEAGYQLAEMSSRN